MRLSRFTGAQITGVTKEKEAGLATVEVCRKHRLARQPEAAHGHGKPDNAILKDLLGKKAEVPRPKVRHGAWCDVGLPGLEATSLRADWPRSPDGQAPPCPIPAMREIAGQRRGSAKDCQCGDAAATSVPGADERQYEALRIAERRHHFAAMIGVARMPGICVARAWRTSFLPPWPATTWAEPESNWITNNIILYGFLNS